MDPSDSKPSETSAISEEVEAALAGAQGPDGVDLTVIRWMLERTPTERLEAVQDLIDGAWPFRRLDET